MDPELKDEDVEAVKKAFKVLSSAVENNNGNFQIIVLDHAPESAWGDIREEKLENSILSKFKLLKGVNKSCFITMHYCTYIAFFSSRFLHKIEPLYHLVEVIFI